LTVLFIALVAFGMLHPQTGAIGIFYTRADTLAFAAGIWLAIATRRETSRQYSIQAISALMLGIGSFVIIAVNYAVLRELFVTQLWVMFACVAILWAMVELEEKIAASVPRWLVFSGDASYSIYLFHMFGIGATYKLGSALLPHEYMGIFLPVAFIGGTVAGIAAYLFIEKPLLGYISTRNWSFRQAKA
jgi:exopolysaccharide production protein ExoZ